MEVAATPTFARKLREFLGKDVEGWFGAVMSKEMYLRRYALNTKKSKEAGKVPLPDFMRTVNWLRRADLTMTG